MDSIDQVMATFNSVYGLTTPPDKRICGIYTPLAVCPNPTRCVVHEIDYLAHILGKD